MIATRIEVDTKSGILAVTDLHTHTLLGWCFFRIIDPNNLHYYDSDIDEFNENILLFVDFLFTHWNARRRGVASQIIEFFEDYGVRESCRAITLDTHTTNEVARAFYAKLGFKTVGRLRLTGQHLRLEKEIYDFI